MVYALWPKSHQFLSKSSKRSIPCISSPDCRNGYPAKNTRLRTRHSSPSFCLGDGFVSKKWRSSVSFLFGKKQNVQSLAEVLEDGREIMNTKMKKPKYNNYSG